MDVHTYVWMCCFLQLVRDQHLEGYEEEVDAFIATQIADTVRKYQLESSEDATPNAECDSTYIEHFAQKVLLWTAGKSQAEIFAKVEVPAKDQTVHVCDWRDPSVPVLSLGSAHILDVAIVCWNQFIMSIHLCNGIKVYQ